MITGEQVNRLVLGLLKKCWSQIPSENNFTDLEPLIQDIKKKNREPMVDIILAASLKHLVNEGFARTLGEEKIRYMQITKEGRMYYENMLEKRRTFTFAIVGALSGSLSLLIHMIKLFM